MGFFRTTTGPMNSGKSAYLIVEYNNLKLSDLKVLTIKSSLDTRDGRYITSRALPEQIVPVDVFVKPTEDIPVKKILAENYDVIICDEMQMLTELQIRQLHYLAVVSDVYVYMYGLKISFDGMPFPSSALAISLSDEHIKLITINKQKQRKDYAIKYANLMPVNITNVQQIEAGGDDIYKSVSKEEYFTTYKEVIEDSLGINKPDELEWVLGVEVSISDHSVRESLLEEIYKSNVDTSTRHDIRYFERQKVETNPSVIQLNRMTLVRKLIDGMPHFLITKRIKASTEKRLLDIHTSLFGGHTNLVDRCKYLQDILEKCRERELFEELVFSGEILKTTHTNKLIYTPNNEDEHDVSNFHACDLVIVDVSADTEVEIVETHKLSKCKFLSPTEILELELETWSDVAISYATMEDI